MQKFRSAMPGSFSHSGKKFFVLLISSGAKVARELADKGRCASEGIWYYGAEVHIPESDESELFRFPTISALPRQASVIWQLSDKSSPVLAIAKRMPTRLISQTKPTDNFPRTGNRNPDACQKKKGRKTLGLSEKLFPKDVSGVRQPIESLFDRIREKTNIEIASKVRSYKGLMVHVFGRLAAAMFMLVFNP